MILEKSINALRQGLYPPEISGFTQPGTKDYTLKPSLDHMPPLAPVSTSFSSRWFIWAFTIATVILVVVSSTAYISLGMSKEAYAWRGHAHIVRTTLEQLQSSLVDAETAERGYLLTDLDEYLAPYEQALMEVPAQLTSLHQLTIDNADQQKRLNALDPLVAHKLALVRNAIDVRRKQGFEAAQRILMTGEHKRTMDDIRAVISEMRESEDLLLGLRTNQAVSDANRAATLMIFGNVLALIVVLTTAFFMVRNVATLHGSLLAVREQEWLQSRLAGLGQLLREEQDVSVLGQRTLDHLTAVLATPIAALYHRSEGDAFLLIAGYALEHPRQSRFALGEGLVGEAARTRRLIHIDDVPSGYLPIASSLGVSSPGRVAVVPLIYRDHVEGVLELGTFRDWSVIQLAFLERAGESIAAALASTRSLAQIKELLSTSQQQEEELRMQQEELTQSNEELEEQAQQLARRNEEVEEGSRDIEAARRDLEEKATQLALSSKYKSEFMSNMSHELRTPLNSLLILSQLLYENPTGNLSEKQVKYAHTVNSSGRDLLTLINDLLDLTKIESGTVVLDISAISFSEINETIERTMRPIAQQKGLEFTIRLGDRLPPSLRSDDIRLQQVLKNLLSNAFKFTPVDATRPGHVSLSIKVATSGWSPDHPQLTRTDTVIAFAVSDNGIGIPASKLQLIFEAFQQADGSVSRKYGGTGLGLSISREIAHLLGGELCVISTEGVGSTFTLYLPRHAEASPASHSLTPSVPVHSHPRATAALTPAQVGTSTPSSLVEDDHADIHQGDRVVLIVEDDPAFARILVELAHEHGFKALVSMGGTAVLNLAREMQPDGITLDIHLSDSSGWHLLDQLKYDSATRHIPVHVITIDDVRERALRQGAHGVMIKPTSRDALGHTFQTLVNVAEHVPRRLLVIEDNEVERDAIVDAIGNSAVVVTTVIDSTAAIAALSGQHFDCIVLDLGLPGMSGQHLLETLHDHSVWRTIPVIIYTARDLTPHEEILLRPAAKTIVLKTGSSLDHLLDETTLFLHRVHGQLPAAKRQRIERIHQSDASLTGRTVLVVDDDARNVFALTGLLERYGMIVMVAEDGRAALACLENTKEIALVLMDLMMPEMDGYTAMRAIRLQPAWKTLPIIALTAKAMKGDREQCLAAGASDYITKPANCDQLLSMLRVWLYR